MASAIHGGKTGMLDRQARLRGSAIERLEARGLLSVVAPIRSAPIDLPDGDRVAAEVISPAMARSGSRSSLPEPGSGAPARTARSGPGTLPVSVSPPVVRTNPAGSAVVKRSAPPDPDPRELPEPPSLVRHNQPATGGDPAAPGPEMMSGPGGPAFDPAGASALVGWAPVTTTPVVVSLANPAERVAGLELRAGTSPGSSAAVRAP